MSSEEAKAYFIKCNEDIVSVAKDENTYDYEKQEICDVCMKRTFEANNKAIKVLEPKTIQEIQAESEKYQKAFEDGYEQGYAQARFDYEQEPCEDCISRQDALNCITASGLKKFDYIIDARDKIKNLPSVKPQEPKLNKLDEIITDALDKSIDQKESQTLRWVLDKISEV